MSVKADLAGGLLLLAGAVAGALGIALGAQFEIPMVPVPTTLQTLVIVLLGLACGWRLAGLAALIYVLLVLGDLPVLSSAQRQGGWAFFDYIAFGYVLGFVPGAMLAGWLGHGRGFWRMLLAGALTHGLILLAGTSVMAAWLGGQAAWERGASPFLLGGLAKSLLAAALVAVWNYGRKTPPTKP